MKIYYYSATCNTKKLAQTLSLRLPGKLIELSPKKEFSSFKPLFFLQSLLSALSKSRLPLKDYERPGDQDEIIICFPIWADDFAAPVLTFLNENELKGARVSLASCSRRSSAEMAWENFKRLQPQAQLNAAENFLTGKGKEMTVDRKDVLSWIGKLKKGA